VKKETLYNVTTVKNNMKIHQKLKIELPNDPAIHSWTYTEEMQVRI
jgi:hypothetical protein